MSLRINSPAGIRQAEADARYKTLEAVIAPTLLNGWVNIAGEEARYRKTPQGIVVLLGRVQTGTVGTAAFNLPVGYRPAILVIWAGWSTAAGVVENVITVGGDYVLNSSNAGRCLPAPAFVGV